jgi:hypothetical protein
LRKVIKKEENAALWEFYLTRNKKKLGGLSNRILDIREYPGRPTLFQKSLFVIQKFFKLIPVN